MTNPTTLSAEQMSIEYIKVALDFIAQDMPSKAVKPLLKALRQLECNNNNT